MRYFRLRKSLVGFPRILVALLKLNLLDTFQQSASFCHLRLYAALLEIAKSQKKEVKKSCPANMEVKEFWLTNKQSSVSRCIREAADFSAT